jgi:hypothetical protein
MKVIYKYEILKLGHNRLEMPQYAIPLSIGFQGDNLMMWAMVEPSNPIVAYDVHAFFTGAEIDTERYPNFVLGRNKFLGTTKGSAGLVATKLVYHVFIDKANCGHD